MTTEIFPQHAYRRWIGRRPPPDVEWAGARMSATTMNDSQRATVWGRIEFIHCPPAVLQLLCLSATVGNAQLTDWTIGGMAHHPG